MGREGVRKETRKEQRERRERGVTGTQRGVVQGGEVDCAECFPEVVQDGNGEVAFDLSCRAGQKRHLS